MILRLGLSFLLIGALLAEPARAVQALSLDEALRLGIAQDPNLRRQRLDVEKARLYLNDAQSERFTYSGDVAVGDRYGMSGLFSNQNLMAGNIPVANATLWGRMPLFTGWRLTHQIHQSEALVSATEARLEKARQDNLWAVTEGYWQARRAEVRESIRATAVTQARQARDVVFSNVKVGRASASELERAEVALLNEQSEWVKAQDERDLGRAQLSSLLQKDLDGLQLSDPPALARPLPATPSFEAVLNQAQEQRPELALARAELARQEAASLSARADYYPQLDLQSAYQHGNNPFIATSQSRDVLSNIVGTFDVRLNLSYHLFDHGSIGRAVSRAEKEVESAREALESARRSVALDVRQALRRLDSAKRRLALGEASTALAAKNLAWSEGRFKAGFALLVELNEARVNLTSSASRHLDAQIDYQLAEAALERAMGRLRIRK